MRCSLIAAVLAVAVGASLTPAAWATPPKEKRPAHVAHEGPWPWDWPFKQTEKKVGVEYVERVVQIQKTDLREWKILVPVEVPEGTITNLEGTVIGKRAAYTGYATEVVKGKLAAVSEELILLAIEGKKEALWQTKKSLRAEDAQYVMDLEYKTATEMGEYKPPEKKKPAAKPPPQYRTWTDSTGQHKTEAIFKGLAAGQVKLLKKDGTQVTMPIEKLSDEDQKWIRKRSK